MNIALQLQQQEQQRIEQLYDDIEAAKQLEQKVNMYSFISLKAYIMLFLLSLCFSTMQMIYSLRRIGKLH